MSEKYDVIIVGAGIIGASCAAECAASGLKVLVLDKGPIGGGTTATCMGHIVVLDDSEAQLALSSYSQRLWNELAPSLPEQVEYVQCGTVWVAADDEEMSEVHRKHKVYTEHGLESKILDSKALLKEEPHLAETLAGGLLVKQDSVVYPPAATYHLLKESQKNGAVVMTPAEVKEILPEGAVVLTDGTKISGNAIVNACGWAAPDFSDNAPIKKRKGHLAITERFEGFLNHQIIELGYLKSAHSATGDSAAFNIQPRKTGQMLVGSSRQNDSETTEVEHRMLSKMIKRAWEYMPSLRDVQVTRTWTGFRPATPDKLPLIGPDGDSGNIWIAAGHEGLGITCSLGTGKLVCNMIIDRPSEIDPKPYCPSRYAKGNSQNV
ncbi:MAG: FAD-binding oxidoreductase [Phycisphaerae bacterium]|nr:FAD-binding oxidoreductase [Phycisphaerae bacterium]